MKEILTWLGISLCLTLWCALPAEGAQVVVLAEPGLGYYMANEMVSPWHLAKVLQRCGVEARCVSAEQLPTALQQPDAKVLVLVYGSYYPATCAKALVAFHEAGGSLVSTGVPLVHPVQRALLHGKPYWQDQGYKPIEAPGLQALCQAKALPAAGGRLELANETPFGLSPAELRALAPAVPDTTVWAAAEATQPVALWKTAAGSAPPIALLAHPGQPGVFDCWAGGNLGRTPGRLDSATACERVLVKAALYCLKARKSFSPARYSSALQALDKVLPLPAPPRPLYLKPSGYAHVLPGKKTTPKLVHVLDLQGKSRAERLLFASLQGLVNRQGPVLYLLLEPEDLFWRKWCYKRRYFKHFKQLASPEAALQQFKSAYKGVVLCDEVSENAALCAAWAQDLLVCEDENLASSAGLKVALDLRGKFTDRASAQQWALQRFFNQATRQVLNVRFPGGSLDEVDYLVQHRIFPYWLDTGSYSHDPLAELKLVRNLLASYPANVPVLGWYTWGDPPRGLSEYWSQLLVGDFGKFMASTCFSTNLSCLSQLAVPQEDLKIKLTNALSPLEDRVYFCFDIMDAGDSPWYLQRYMPALWRQQERGQVPLTWSFTPLIYDLAPALASWYVGTATPKDELMCSVSGLGYVMYPHYADGLSNRDEVKRQFARLSGEYAAKFGFTTCALHMGGWPEAPDFSLHGPLEQFASDAKGQFSLLLADFGRMDATTYSKANYLLPSGALVMHTLTRWRQAALSSEIANRTKQPSAEARALAESIREAAEKAQARPCFINAYALSWTTKPSVAKEAAELLGPEFVPLTAHQLELLVRRYTKAKTGP